MHDAIHYRLAAIVRKYPQEIGALLDNLGIGNKPTADVLLLAYIQYPKKVVQGIAEIGGVTLSYAPVISIDPVQDAYGGNPITDSGVSVDPSGYSVGYNGVVTDYSMNYNGFTQGRSDSGLGEIWMGQRQRARMGNRLTSTKRFGGKATKGQYQLMANMNPTSEVFTGGQYFKQPLRFNPHVKGKVSTDPAISPPTDTKEYLVTGVRKSPIDMTGDLIPGTQDGIENLFRSARKKAMETAETAEVIQNIERPMRLAEIKSESVMAAEEREPAAPVCETQQTITLFGVTMNKKGFLVSAGLVIMLGAMYMGGKAKK